MITDTLIFLGCSNKLLRIWTTCSLLDLLETLSMDREMGVIRCQQIHHWNQNRTIWTSLLLLHHCVAWPHSDLIGLSPLSKTGVSPFHHGAPWLHWVTGKDTGTWLDWGAGDPLFMACGGTVAGSTLLICVMNRRRSFKAGFKLQIIFST